MSRDNFGVRESNSKAPETTAGPGSSTAQRQFAHPGEGDASGGNLSGHNPKAWNPIMVPDFQGPSGQSDNRPIHRKPGHT